MPDLRLCPFCRQDGGKLATNQTPIGVNGLDDRVFRYRAYVRCTKCHARGPIASGRVMYVTYSLPDWADMPESIKARAVENWNAVERWEVSGDE